MSVLIIKGMEMPQTGVYEIAVDNTWGKDKTIMTLYTRKDNGMLHVFGSYELVLVPPHGRLIAEDAAIETAWMILAGLGYRRDENPKLEQAVCDVFSTAPAIEVE